MRFPPDFLNTLRERLPISQLVARYVTFDEKKSKLARRDFWACCPFHADKTPSFHCNDHKNSYYCFSCHRKGDIFSFIMELEKLDFSQAVEKLAHIAQLSLPQPSPREYKKAIQQLTLYKVMAMANEYFVQKLQHAQGAPVRLYLESRGITLKAQQCFSLGHAPLDHNGLVAFLRSKGVEMQQMVDCGLVAYDEGRRQYYERFRGRLMFPILDKRKRVIAFGGRSLQQNALAKYLNSPETSLFSKGNVLYNIASAWEHNRYKAEKSVYDPLLVVEGYMDCVSLVQAGFSRTVAVLGTALTEAQLEQLWQLDARPLVCLDGDRAGVAAAARVIERALPLVTAERSLAFILLPDGQDPDELISMNGVEAFIELTKRPLGFFDMLWTLQEQLLTDDAPETISRARAALEQKIARITDKNVRSSYFQAMKDRFWSLRGRQRTLSKSGRKVSGAVSVSYATSFLGKRAEAECLTLVLEHPWLVGRYLAEFTNMDFNHSFAKALKEGILSILVELRPQGAEEFTQLLSQQGLGGALKELNIIAQPFNFIWKKYKNYSESEAEAHFVSFLGRVKDSGLEKEKAELKERVSQNPDLDILPHLQNFRENWFVRKPEELLEPE